MMPRLEQWHMDYAPGYSGWTAPEMKTRVLFGVVTGHPRKRDGEHIHTSGLVSARGRVVVTEGGTTYELGEPKADYLAWMQKTGIPFDPENPIRIVDKFSNIPRHELKGSK